MTCRTTILLVAIFLPVFVTVASAEIKVVPNGATFSPVQNNGAKTVTPVPVQNGNHKIFGTINKSNQNHTKQKSARAVFKSNKGNTVKWY